MGLQKNQKVDVNEVVKYLFERSRTIKDPTIILKNLEELVEEISPEKAKKFNIILFPKERMFHLRKLTNAKNSILCEKLPSGEEMEWTHYYGYFQVIHS